MPTTKTVRASDDAELWTALVSNLIEGGHSMPEALAWVGRILAALGPRRVRGAERETVRFTR
jgi:hypothetical protein